MSDLVSTAVVIFLSLALVTLMLVARLRAGGLSPRRTSMLIAQLWLTIGVIVALFVAVSSVLGTPVASGGLRVEFDDIGHRFGALSAESKWLTAIGAVLALGLFAHLIYSLGRAMRAAPPP
jgi:hypothetical protein